MAVNPRSIKGRLEAAICGFLVASCRNEKKKITAFETLGWCQQPCSGSLVLAEGASLISESTVNRIIKSRSNMSLLKLWRQTTSIILGRILKKSHFPLHVNFSLQGLSGKLAWAQGIYQQGIIQWLLLIPWAYIYGNNCQ